MFVVRVLILLVAAGGVLAAFSIGRKDVGGPASGKASETFTCPMHPEVIATIRGSTCPICRMALVSSAPAGGAKEYTLPPDRPSLPEQDLAPVKRRRLSREITAPGWLDSGDTGWALLHRGEAMPGDVARFLPAGADPAAEVAVQIAADTPERWDDAVVSVRFHVARGAGALPLNQVGWLKLGERAFDGVTVPVSAIVNSPEGPCVLVAKEDGRTLVRRPIEVGRYIGGQAPVASGVREGERVVARNASFLAAEQRLP